MFNNIYHNRKVLLTGHTGFKGSWLALWLKELGAEVLGIALAPNTQPSHFELLKLGLDSHLVDIRDYEKIAKIMRDFQPEMVFHLAAQPLVRDSYGQPLYTLETNVIGTANVLQAGREIEALRAVVVITSDKCYENKERPLGYRESDPMGGYDPYSASKGCAELVTACFRNSYFNLNDFGKKHQVLLASARAGNVIGGGDWSKDRLIPDIVKAVAANQKVLIRNPQATRPWQHVLECLSGYLCLGEKLWQREPAFAEAWNFAPSGDEMITVGEIVKKMQLFWSKIHYEIAHHANAPHEANLLKLDATKANTLLHWQEVWNLEKTLEITINWYRNFYEDGVILTPEDIRCYVKDASGLGLLWVK